MATTQQPAHGTDVPIASCRLAEDETPEARTRQPLVGHVQNARAEKRDEIDARCVEVAPKGSTHTVKVSRRSGATLCKLRHGHQRSHLQESQHNLWAANKGRACEGMQATTIREGTNRGSHELLHREHSLARFFHLLHDGGV